MTEPINKFHPIIIDLTGDSDDSPVSSPVNVSSAGDKEQYFPTPFLDYINYNRKLNVSVLTGLMDVLQDQLMEAPEDLPAKRFKSCQDENLPKKPNESWNLCEEGVLYINPSITTAPVPSNDDIVSHDCLVISCSNSLVKRFEPDSTVEIDPKTVHKYSYVCHEKFNRKPATFTRDSSASLLPSNDVMEGTVLLDSCWGNSSVKPPTPDSTVQIDSKRSEESSRFEPEVDYDALKRVLEMFAPLPEIAASAVAGAAEEREGDVSMTAAEDATYACSSDINHERGTERYWLNDSIASYSKQSSNYEERVYDKTNDPARNPTHVVTNISTDDKKGTTIFSTSLNSDVGAKYIFTVDVYFIIIGWSVEWMLVITKFEAKSPFPSLLRPVRSSYTHLLTYYNTYFPLLLLKCWKKVHKALLRCQRRNSEERHEWQWEIKMCDRQESFIDILCEIIIPKNDEPQIPTEGDVILVNPKDAIKMLAYVHSSHHRAYYAKYDCRHKTIKNLKAPVGDLCKIKISFYVVIDADFSNLEFMKVSKLTNVKTLLKQNDALLDLPKSPLFKIVLDPPHHDILKICLPRNENSDRTSEIVRQLSECVQTPFEQLILLTYSPCSNAISILIQLTDELKKSQHRPKTLLCVDDHLLDSIGFSLLDLQTLAILNRERDVDLHQQLQSFSFDEMVNKRRNSTGAEMNVAQFEVLKECDVILAMTRNCFYRDIAEVLPSKIQLEICIIFQAHHFTESEAILPLQYGCKKLILIGDPDAPFEVGSMKYDYHQSLFFRVYNAC